MTRGMTASAVRGRHGVLKKRAVPWLEVGRQAGRNETKERLQHQFPFVTQNLHFMH